VARDGRPTASTVVEDPGSGFGPAAVRCAMQQVYAPLRATSRAASRRALRGHLQSNLIAFA
jgi:hypothetical protein